MNKKNFFKPLFLLIIAALIIIPTAAFAANGDYPSSTTNKDSVITINKSASWNDTDAHSSNYEATIHLEASGIQKVVEYLPATVPVDFSFILDESGSMSSCLSKDRVDNMHRTFNMISSAALTDDAKKSVLNSIESSTQAGEHRHWIVRVAGLSDSANTIYAVPVSTFVNKNSLAGWSVFSVAANGTAGKWKDGILASYYPSVNSAAPYYIGHFVMDTDTGTIPKKHVVYAHDTNYYLSEPISAGAGWRHNAEAGPNATVDFRSTADLNKAENDFECSFLQDVVRDSSGDFFSKIVAAERDGKLSSESTISVIPFSGVVDTANLTTQTKISASGLETAARNKINTAFQNMGFYTNWGDAVERSVSEVQYGGTGRQKIVLFFTDGYPQVANPEDPVNTENLNQALRAAQSLYNTSTNNRMYGVFLNSDNGDLANMCRVVNATNKNNPNDTSSSGYIESIDVTTSAEDVSADLEQVYDDILTYLIKWSKSTEIIAVSDTISKYYQIDKSKLAGTEGKDWEIEKTNDGLEKITFYTTINGFTKIDSMEAEIPIVLKEKYRSKNAYYPTNTTASCAYKDIQGKRTSVSVPTPYLPIKTLPKVDKELIKINSETAKVGSIFTVGDILEYEIHYENNTEDTVTVTISDTIPFGSEFVAADRGGKLEDDIVTWIIEDVPPGTEDSVKIKLRVTPDADKEIINTATVKVGTQEGQDTEKGKNPLIKKTLLSINDEYKVEDGAVVHAGDILEYVIEFTNFSDANTVTITDPIPEGMEFISADNGGEVYDDDVVWKVNLKKGEKGEVKVRFRVTENARIKVENQASVAFGNGPASNTNKVINPLPSAVKSLMSMNGTDAKDGAAVTVGDNVEYQIYYTNPTNRTCDITITDPIPKGTEFLSADNDGTLKDGIVTWHIADVAPYTDGFVTLKITVTKDAVKKIVNKAAVQIGDKDPIDTNDVINPLVKKTLAGIDGKEAEDGSVVLPDKTVSYTIHYANVQDEPQKVVITDTLPKGTEFVSANPEATVKDNTVTWVIEKVAPDSEGKVELTLKVVDRTVGQIVNTADVTIGDLDPKTTNEVVNPLPDVVKTGDDFPLFVWTSLAVIALAGLFIFRNRKQKINFDDLSQEES